MADGFKLGDIPVVGIRLREATTLDYVTCKYCRHFLGGGDFGTCCDQRYDLCYKNTKACEYFDPIDGAVLEAF